MNWAALLAALAGGAIGGAASGGSGLSREQKRLLGIQGDMAEVERDLQASRAGIETANMPQVLQTVFSAVNNQLQRPRTQVLGPNFQPRLRPRGTLAPLTYAPGTTQTFNPQEPEVDAEPYTPPPFRGRDMGTAVPNVDPALLNAAAMALLQGQGGLGLRNIRRAAEGAATPIGRESLYNPYSGQEMYARQGSQPTGGHYQPPGAWGAPGGDAADVPPGAGTDLSPGDTLDALWRQFASGVQGFTHLPPVSADRTLSPQQAHDWVVMLSGHAADPLNPDVPRIYKVSQEEAIKWVQSGRGTIIADPLTGEAWRNPDNSTMIQVVTPTSSVIASGDASGIPPEWGVPPEIAATLASQNYYRDPATGVIYNSVGGVIYRGNPDRVPVPFEDELLEDELPPKGPKKVRR